MHPASSVAFCTLVEEDYSIGLAALLKSIRQSNPHIEIPFLVYVLRPLSAEARRRIEREYPLIRYASIDASLYTRCLFSNYRNWGLSPAFRYEIFRNDEYDQLIYLDTDMLVVDNIDRLLQFRGALAACTFPPGEGMELIRTGGFNAGLMSIGRQLRTPDIWRNLLTVAESRPWTGNQTVLNLVLGRYVEALPEEYNLRTAGMTLQNLASARIVHYVGWRKPWEKEEPFDPYQRSRAGEEVCNALLALWERHAPLD